MYSESLIKLALLNQKGTQKALAAQLKVSPTQISKWKSGEMMSFEMEDRVRQLAGIGERSPNLVYLTGGIEQADKWNNLINYLAVNAIEQAETGYHTEILRREEDYLADRTINILKEMGVKIPSEFPDEIIIPSDEIDQYSDADHEALMIIPIVNSISTAFLSANDVYGFYAAYISGLLAFEFTDFDPDDFTGQVYSELLAISFAKTGEQSQFSPTFNNFAYDTKKILTKLIDSIKMLAMHNNLPLKAELSDLISGNSGWLGHEAERESLGYNSERIHPDIYMNEILCSHRLIHQVLPIICKKLGITPEELEIDETKFTV
jgi:transcriptional regulator with XRE-family HTH domain